MNETIAQRVFAKLRWYYAFDDNFIIDRDHEFDGDYGGTFIGCFSLIESICDEFAISLDEDDAQGIHTVGQLVQYVEQYAAESDAAHNLMDITHPRCTECGLSHDACETASDGVCNYCRAQMDDCDDDGPHWTDPFPLVEVQVGAIDAFRVIESPPNQHSNVQFHIHGNPVFLPATPGMSPVPATTESNPMAYAKLSLAQASSIILARQHADADTRKLIKREIFAAAKQAYGIPQTTKLRVEEADASHPDYLVLKDSAAGTPFTLDPNTGLWLGATAVPPADKRWFRVPAAAVRTALVDWLSEQDDHEMRNFAPSETPTDDDGGDAGVTMDSDGDVYVLLDADTFAD